MRHRIQELFSQEDIDGIRAICNDPANKDNNMKGDKIQYLLRGRGFAELGSGTNRLALMHSGYVFKFALDSYGFRDNMNEFNMAPELQPFVTKTYETNGYIAIAEYANLITKQEFFDSEDHIRSILEVLAENYLFCDMGIISKNYLNYGFLDSGELVIIDYGYIYKRDEKIMFCKKCGNPLRWTPDFTALKCIRCGKAHDPLDIRDRMWKKEGTFMRDKIKDLELNDKGELDIEIEI